MNAHPFSTDSRRLRLPEPLPPYEGNYEAHKYGASCPQHRMLLPQGLNVRLAKDVNNIIAMMYEDVTPDSEDCKSLRVIFVYGHAEHVSIVRLDDQRCYTWGYDKKIKSSSRCSKQYTQKHSVDGIRSRRCGLVDFWGWLRNRWNCHVCATLCLVWQCLIVISPKATMANLSLAAPLKLGSQSYLLV